MNDFKQHLLAELVKLDPSATPLKIQVRDSRGAFTKWINIPHTTAELLEALSPAPRINVIGKLWADTNGNTYHTAEIYLNGAFFGKSPVTYGYGRQYAWTALKMLQEGGIVADTETSPPLFNDDKQIRVTRKRDL